MARAIPLTKKHKVSTIRLAIACEVKERKLEAHATFQCIFESLIRMSAGVETFDCLQPAQLPDEIGRLGPYRILSALGRGGMGQVFRAEDTRLERVVALKVMHKRYATTPGSRKRFIYEARSMAAVKHDNVVTVYEVGEHAGTPFLAMELLKGHTFEAIIKPSQRAPFSQIFDYAIQISRGLAAAHARGIVHRDIKPANIWIEEPGGRVKILDFGLALAGGPIDGLPGRGTVVGTPGYLSPEQAQSDPLDDRCDLYSVGVLLYELCCGRPPFVSTTISEQLIKVIAHVPERPDGIATDLPRPYADLIMRLLAKEPRDRVRSAVALEELLESTKKKVHNESHAAMQIVTAVPTTSGASSGFIKSSVEEKQPSRMIWIVATAISATVLLAGGVWFLAQPERIANQRRVTKPTTVPSAVVTDASLKALQLKSVLAGSQSVPEGQQARFKMQLVNTATDGKSDPRVINARVKVVAQVKTFLKPDGGAKRVAPAFPKKLSIAQIPGLGLSSAIEIPFSTAGIPPGEYEVIFELQSPGGGLVGEESTRFLVVENLASADLLGFDILRTGRGRGADTFVDKDSTDDMGGRSFVAAHKHKSSGGEVSQHSYLRFDLKALSELNPMVDGSSRIDRVVLLLSIGNDGLRWQATINAYGVPADFQQDWGEKGEKHLTWATSPSAKQVESLPFLGQAEFDNTTGAQEKQPDQIRIFGTALDDYVRQASENVTILLVRQSSGETETRFESREGNAERAPALAIRSKPRLAMSDK